MLGLGLNPAMGCPPFSTATGNSPNQFSPSPLPKGDPQCEALTPVILLQANVVGCKCLLLIYSHLSASLSLPPACGNSIAQTGPGPRDFPSQLDNALHARKDKNVCETDLVWLVDYLDEVCNKQSLFSSLCFTHGGFPDSPSDMSDNVYSALHCHLNTLTRVRTAVA